MKKLFTLTLICLIAFGSIRIHGQNGHRIEFNIKNYDGDKVTLAYHYGNKKYISKELTAIKKGTFIAKGNEELKPGMYVLVLTSKKNEAFDFLVTKKDQNFKISTDINNISGSMVIDGSVENKNFYKYVNFLDTKRTEINKLNKELKQIHKAKNNTYEEKSKIAEINKVNDEVRIYQNAVIDFAPESFTAKIIKTELEVTIPEEIKNDNLKAFNYYREHFLDNIDFSDERFLRTSFISQKVNQYLSDQLTGQDPKTAIKHVDKVLKLSEVNEELYKQNLIELINIFAKSKTPCMNAVYVHIVDNYYAKDKAPWISKEQLKKIRNDADNLRGLLCSNIAPELNLRTFENLAAQISLRKVKSNYTLLIFWNPNDEYFQNQIQELVKFYEKVNKNKFKVFTVCDVKTNIESINKCKNAIEKYKMEKFINTIDLNQDSNFREKYFLKSTPLTYLLNNKKEIIIDRLSISTMVKYLTRKK